MTLIGIAAVTAPKLGKNVLGEVVVGAILNVIQAQADLTGFLRKVSSLVNIAWSLSGSAENVNGTSHAETLSRRL